MSIDIIPAFGALSAASPIAGINSLFFAVKQPWTLAEV